MPSKVCVIGEGSWGTAIASLLANNGYDVNLWCHDPKVADSINKNNINSVYFPKIKLDQKIKAVLEFSKAFDEVEYIFEAIPVKFLRNVLVQAKPYFNKNQKWVILSKGFERETLFFPSQLLNDVFGYDVKKAIVSGPSFANELIEKKLTAVDIAGTNETILADLKNILENNYFKVNFCSDEIGMQVTGAFKNIVAIIMGLMQAKNYSDNTKAYIFTKCINEIKILLEFFGGKNETLFGLSGIGDLVLTCYGKHSKNLKLGLEIGSGKKIDEIIKSQDTMPEGINTIEAVFKLIQENKFNMPLFKGVYNFIFQDANFDEIILSLN